MNETDLSPLPIPGEPLAATNAWRTAVQRADGQCEDVRTRAGRCSRTLAGHHRLYVWTDGHAYCKQHFDDRRLGRR